MLEAAGWENSGKGYREKGGPLEVVFRFQYRPLQADGRVVTPMLQDAGFKVDLKILERGTYERTLKGTPPLSCRLSPPRGWPWMTWFSCFIPPASE
jgi:ABC-type transport system substrate-binding protein